MSRRRALGTAAGLVAAAGVGTAVTTPVSDRRADAYSDTQRLPAGTPQDRGRLSYGPDHSRQSGWLLVPDPLAWGDGSRTPSHPVVVLIHGGSWNDASDPSYMADLAWDLGRYGVAVWVPMYRGLDGPGGWPMTFQDVAAAVDAVADLGRQGRFRPQLDRVHLIGHSAGGHLAAWAGCRTSLPPGAPGADPRVRAASVTAMAGVYDLALVESQPGGQVIRQLLGGAAPQDAPQRYRMASPVDLLPVPVPVNVAHGGEDQTVPLETARTFLDALDRTHNPGQRLILQGADHDAWVDAFGLPWNRARSMFLTALGPD